MKGRTQREKLRGPTSSRLNLRNQRSRWSGEGKESVKGRRLKKKTRREEARDAPHIEGWGGWEARRKKEDGVATANARGFAQKKQQGPLDSKKRAETKTGWGGGGVGWGTNI